MFIVNRIVFLINSIFILALLASYLAPFISPDLFWPFAFLGLTFPLLLIINFIFIIYWLAFFNMRFLFSLAAIVIGWSHITEFVQLNAKKSPERKPHSLSVISFNARYFGIMDNVASQEEELFAEKLNKLDADVICMQEMFVNTDDKNSTLHQSFKKKFISFHKANIKVKGDKWYCDNMGILSKYPIINKGVIEKNPESYNYTIFADILFDGDTIRVINTHLQSIKFEKRDYQAVEQLKVNQNPEEVDVYKNIISKMKYAYLLRAKQTDSISDFIAQCPYKIIVCGDFNDSPLSYAYRTIKGEMKDAFIEAGSGLGRTYVGRMPSFRIDYIFGHQQFEFYNYYAKAFDFSDHKLVSCMIKTK
ncbi:MAG: endonuclease/exonuclease/phosphatase family protein [Bacteroidia bacterium]|jgi:endonuclease/exonuclease/phosphatase family metal-dependent hydrolase|nr:endonuclease/exonuclease/phosphatase family protein [Bacteroidia bacterium]